MDWVMQVKEIGKRIDGREILSGCNFRLDKGEVHALIGPNGAGKTTLLRILNLIERPTSGKLDFNGLQGTADARTELRKEITMVFQQPVLFKTTVYKNVAYGLKVRKLPSHEVRERVREALRLVGMEDYGHQRAWTLSSGEAQRVALARALAVRPRLLCMDEPTANLDPYNARKVEETIRKIKTRYGTTILLATHNLFQAQRLCDGIIFLYNGRVIETSDTRTFFERPKEELSRRFIKGDLV